MLSGLFLISWAILGFFWGEFIHYYYILTNKQIKTKHLNTDLEVEYHGNGRSFEAFGSALHNM